MGISNFCFGLVVEMVFNFEMFLLGRDFGTFDSTWFYSDSIALASHPECTVFHHQLLPPMDFVVGGSCVDRAIHVADRSLRLPIHRQSFPASDFFLSARNKTEFKDLGFLLEHGSLKTRKNIVSCHEVINLDYVSNNNEELLKLHLSPAFEAKFIRKIVSHDDCQYSVVL